MRIKAKIVRTFHNAGKLKAIATVCLDNEFLVTGVRVAECQKGMSVFMPSLKMKGRDEEYQDVCFPITRALRTRFNNAVLNAYDEYVKISEQEG